MLYLILALMLALFDKKKQGYAFELRFADLMNQFQVPVDNCI